MIRALACIGLFISGCMVASAAAADQSAYFVFEQEAPDGKVNRFIFRVDNAATIEEARAILAEGRRNNHVQGQVVSAPATYNPEWSFHLAPASIGFFEFQIEVCDANMTYVETHLDEVGGSFLPRGFWCPWSSKIVEEMESVDGGKITDTQP